MRIRADRLREQHHLELRGRRGGAVAPPQAAPPRRRAARDAVVLATGPWTAGLGSDLVAALPVTARRHELALVDPGRALPSSTPWLIGLDQQVHARRDVAGRILIGGFLGVDDAVDPDEYDTRASAEWVRRALSVVDATFGLLGADATVVRSWAGVYPSTPDHHPIIDELAPGLYGALGFSGTGLMHAPAAGLLIGELVIDGAMTSTAAAQLAADRFGTGALDAEQTGF